MDRRRVVLAQIQADMESDVRRDDSLPFTGSNVGRSLGEIRAAVDALARVLDSLIEAIDQEAPRA